MSYISDTLSSGEQVVYQAKVSLLSALLAFIIGGLLILGGLPMFLSQQLVSEGRTIAGWEVAIGVLLIVIAVLRRVTTELAVTNKRVIAKTGIIGRKTVELNLKKVETIQVNQGILGRLLNYGSIVVAGAGNPQAPIPFISSPLKFRRAVTDAQEKFSPEKAAA